jgi:hypothetical protein
MELLEINGQQVEKYEYTLSKQDRENGEQEPRCSIDIQGESLRSGKTKALIIIMPHYDNDTPTVINVGLNGKEIDRAIDIADGVYHDVETYTKIISRLRQHINRLEIKLDKAEEKIGEVQQ